MTYRTRRLASVLAAQYPEKKINHLAQKYPNLGTEPDHTQNMLYEMTSADPAKGKSLEWIARMTMSKNIRWPEDSWRVQKALKSFWSVKKSPRLLQQYKVDPDLNKYTLHELEDAADRIEGRSGVFAQELRIPEGAEKIYDDGEWAIVQPQTTEAACSLASGTRWCTSDPDTADSYLQESGLYVIYRNGKKVAQTDAVDQIMDLQDREIEMSPDWVKVLKQVASKMPAFSSKIPLYNTMGERMEDSEEEALQMSEADTSLLMDYMKQFPKGERNEAAEEAILSRVGRIRDNKLSEAILRYTRDIAQQRWPEAEPHLLKTAAGALRYAVQVLRQPWVEAEKKAVQLIGGQVRDVMNNLPVVEKRDAANNYEGYSADHFTKFGSAYYAQHEVFSYVEVFGKTPEFDAFYASMPKPLQDAYEHAFRLYEHKRKPLKVDL